MVACRTYCTATAGAPCEDDDDENPSKDHDQDDPPLGHVHVREARRGGASEAEALVELADRGGALDAGAVQLNHYAHSTGGFGMQNP